MKNLKVYGEALEFVRAMRPVVLAIAKHDQDLARQLRKALTSIPLNIAEGAWRRGGNSRVRFETAMGSANEVASIMQTADAMGYIVADAALLDEADRFARVLNKLSR